MYGIEQSTNTPYNLCGSFTCEMLNHSLTDLLKALPKEQKSNWPLHLTLLVFAYNVMPHSTSGYQSYELMFGNKTPTICDVWLRMANYMTIFHKASVHGLTNSMNSSLLQTGMYWKELYIVQNDQSPRQEEKPSTFFIASWFSLEQNCSWVEDKLSSTTVDFIRSEG